MKRKAALFAGALAALAALVFRRRRRSATEAQTAPGPAPDPRAEELRRRLDEARVSEAERPASDVPPPADEFEAMRRRVHAEGRAARDAMERSAEDAGESSG